LCSNTAEAGDDVTDALYEQFRSPSREHSVRPFWFWNGELTPAEVQRQIESMSAQGVHGAYAHCRSGLRPRYLTEEWWELVRAAAEKARELDFAFGVVDEYNWPSGDARDYALQGYPSRVLARNPEFRMRTLVPSTGFDPAAQYVVAGRRLSTGVLDADSLRRLDGAPPESQDLAVWSFTLEDAVSFDGGLVDLMNPHAVGAFVELVYDEYARRLGPEVGRSFRGFFCDHEGDYGYRLAWTAAFPAEFEHRKGYDLVPRLPLLLEDGGPRTPVVRCDYFDVVSDLYAESFFGQLASWAEEHGVDVTGHVWEESLQAATAFQGDHFRIQRAFTTPGIDSLFEWGRKPRHFLEARSVAHFRGRGLVVENQGVQGADSYLSLERVKRTTNMIACWGTTTFVPHALNGNPDRIDFPEDWFEGQPWWPYFRHYADYTARLSSLNAGGRHVCEILLYYPIESIWAHGDPCFSREKWDYIFEGADDYNGPRVTWGNPADEIDRVYGEIIETLPAHQWDLDVVDAHYLDRAEIADGRIRIGDESFSVLVLPPMTCMRVSAARRVREFADAGGLVVVVGRLPADSMENGRDDPVLAAELAAAQPFRVASVDELVELLEHRVAKDVRVEDGNGEGLYVSHRVKDGRDVYYVVNDTGAERHATLRLRAGGRPELWDPDGGGRRPLAARRVEDGTIVELAFDPWQAYYVVFSQGEPAPHAAEPRAEGLLVLEGPWRVTPVLGETPACYARTALCREGEGLARGFHRPNLNDRFWSEEWLSPERFTLRDWWVIGPFDYLHHLGYEHPYPPEHELDLDAVYEGKDGVPVRWRRWLAPNRAVDLDAATGHRLKHWGGMQFKTGYALTHVEAPDELGCELRVVGDSNAKAWLNGEPVLTERDDHQGYLELRDAFGFRCPVRLRAGRNTLLLKVSQAMRYGGTFGFVARLCDADGSPVLPGAPDTTDVLERWYRIAVPAGTEGVRLPAGAEAAQLWLDGEQVDVVESSREAVLSVRMPAGGELAGFPVFELGPAERLLGPLTGTGLSFYCGTFAYETELELPAAAGDRLLLDLGIVGSAAEVWLNGQKAGERVWRPYLFDITPLAREGRNALRVLVANTRANERARGPHQLALWDLPVRGPALLDRIDENGLHGPVRVLRAGPVPDLV
jgi:alpha-L-rhamnosidase/Glycosyl hydrolase 2 galactose-binding domain-like